MMFVLPAPGESLSALETTFTETSTLASAALLILRAHLRANRAGDFVPLVRKTFRDIEWQTIAIPRFKLESDFSLKKASVSPLMLL